MGGVKTLGQMMMMMIQDSDLRNPIQTLISYTKYVRRYIGSYNSTVMSGQTRITEYLVGLRFLPLYLKHTMNNTI